MFSSTTNFAKFTILGYENGEWKGSGENSLGELDPRNRKEIRKQTLLFKNDQIKEISCVEYKIYYLESKNIIKPHFSID